MIKNSILLLFVLLILISCSQTDSVAEKPALVHQYLGQEAPGLKPILFAPEIISIPATSDRDVTFTPDLREMYFSRNARIMVTKLTDSVWSEAERVSFSADYNEFEAFITHDGKRLYYISQRPLSGTGDPEPFQIWYVDRIKSGWGEPKRFSDRGDYFPTVTTDGIMYMSGANNDLYTLDLNDKSAAPVKLGDSINSPAREYNSFVAPDGGYLIFTSFGWGDGFGGGDLFISFRKPGGAWGKPKNMGPGINSSAHEYCPSVSPDGKYLFFVSNIKGLNDIFWVDADIIDTLRTKDLNIADILYDGITQKGIQTLKDGHRSIYHAFGEYTDFDGDLLKSVSDRFLRAGKIKDGVGMIAFSLLEFPDNQGIGQQLKYAVLSDNPEMREEVFTELKSEEDLVTAHELEINSLGYFLLQINQIDKAAIVFKLNTELFPESSNVYDSYGETLLAQGDTTAAIFNYRKSLELNPENQNAVDVLKNIE
jgi:WD40-like Beta Propeller Repeat